MVILNRVRTYLEAQLLDAQQGFRQQRGTPDALFSLRRMMELVRQHEAPTHAMCSMLNSRRGRRRQSSTSKSANHVTVSGRIT